MLIHLFCINYINTRWHDELYTKFVKCFPRVLQVYLPNCTVLCCQGMQRNSQKTAYQTALYSSFCRLVIIPWVSVKYRVTAINVSWKLIEWAEWAASLCTANSLFPGHVYCRHPVQCWAKEWALGSTSPYLVAPTCCFEVHATNGLLLIPAL